MVNKIVVVVQSMTKSRISVHCSVFCGRVAFEWWPVHLAECKNVYSIERLNVIVRGSRKRITVTRRYKKIQTTKKLGCRAKIFVKEIIPLPQFGVGSLLYCSIC